MLAKSSAEEKMFLFARLQASGQSWRLPILSTHAQQLAERHRIRVFFVDTIRIVDKWRAAAVAPNLRTDELL